MSACHMFQESFRQGNTPPHKSVAWFAIGRVHIVTRCDKKNTASFAIRLWIVVAGELLGHVGETIVFAMFAIGAANFLHHVRLHLVVRAQFVVYAR